ncbi:MAG: Holliday junction resolvase RuvX [Ahrensia sp.]|nr:Holliday junction resolvase RuvX [Ahrensia sp.]
MALSALTVEEFVGRLQGEGRLLGLDPGTKTIGLAISDSSWAIASPVRTLMRTKFTQDAQELLGYARTEDVKGLIIGLPLNMDGSEGPRAQSTRAFVRNLFALSDLPVLLQDERLSTFEADQAMRGANMSRAKRAAKIDALAAGVILQSALDRLRAVRDG